MIVDTSALLAVLEGEPAAERITDALIRADRPRLTAPTLVEARIVMNARYGPSGVRRLQALLRQFDVAVVAFDEQQADVASDAYRDYGRGTRRPAKLNYGDTFSYALAYVSDEPLLYVGDDFSRTDIRSALEEYGE